MEFSYCNPLVNIMYRQKNINKLITLISWLLFTNRIVFLNREILIKHDF